MSINLKAIALTLVSATVAISSAQEINPDEVAAVLRRSADWGLNHRAETDLKRWTIAPFYDGLLRTADVTGDASYTAAVLRYGTSARWAPGSRIYHADDHAVGHAWLDVFLANEEMTARMRSIRSRFDTIIANPITEELEFGKTVTTPGVAKTDRWTWCDALYMAPPTLARLYSVTGDAKYLEFMHQEFLYTYHMLFDATEGFFYRDSTFIDDRTPNGKKVFWSRGNGWVYGGLALLLEHLPQDYANRSFYEDLFQDMTVAVLAAQQADGLWRPSLADPEHIPVGETSGSGFFTFGLAWGINNGLLDRTTHWAAVEAGWKGLLTRLGEHGLVGYVQQIGSAPAAFTEASIREYGTGAFLLAGSEVLRAIGGAASSSPEVLLASAEQLLDPPFTPTDEGLVNLSTRLTLKSGQIAIQGVVTAGYGDMLVLIRAIGPGLEGFGVTNAMQDPQVILYEDSVPVAWNHDWVPEAIGSAFTLTGAFPLAAGSLDAAMLVVIDPGKAYTVHVTGGDGDILFEIYTVPDVP